MSTRWFDRRFEFGLSAGEVPALVVRLRAAPDRLERDVGSLPADILTHRPDARWSIQEHAGHLGDLEGLWADRLDDFDAGAGTLRPADLGNRKTHEAGHNARALSEVLGAFRRARRAFVERLEGLPPDTLARTALHPRLQLPMNVADLAFFVAEHDDHHLAEIVRARDRLLAMPPYARELLTTVDRVAPRLAALDGELAKRRPAAGRWSTGEIVGHLIDSASNNHQRFVRAAFQDDLVFPGYAQDDWVTLQAYQDASWTDLVTLWASFNRHLAWVMTHVPAAVRAARHTRHSFDRLALRPVPAGEPSTLEYLMEDYVRHLQHHLRQIADRHPDAGL